MAEIRYPNGQIPLDALEFIEDGTNTEGYWQHLLPAATAAKHRALVEKGRRERNKTLVITGGWNGYRPLDVQEYAWDKYGTGAAYPGTSSHGGSWAGPVTNWVKVDTAAIDYGNWEFVWGTRDAFFAACRAVGLTPGAIAEPSFPDEPWHVIDLAPWAGAPASQDSTDFPLPAEPKGTLVDISIVLEAPDYKKQWAIGPRGRVLLNGETADLLNRYLQYPKSNGDLAKAGGMSLAEMDTLIRDVLSRVS